MFAEDDAVMRDTGREKRWPWAILDDQKEMLLRPMPTMFTVHKVRKVDTLAYGIRCNTPLGCVLFDVAVKHAFRCIDSVRFGILIHKKN